MAGCRGGRDERLRRQKEYQDDYRKRIKAERVADRDEIARELLHFAITENLRHKREENLWQIADTVIERLVARGYDLKASQDVFIGIVDRYEKGWTFQRRVHLSPSPEDDAGDEGKSRH